MNLRLGMNCPATVIVPGERSGGRIGGEGELFMPCASVFQSRPSSRVERFLLARAKYLSTVSGGEVAASRRIC